MNTHSFSCVIFLSLWLTSRASLKKKPQQNTQSRIITASSSVELGQAIIVYYALADGICQMLIQTFRITFAVLCYPIVIAILHNFPKFSTTRAHSSPEHIQFMRKSTCAYSTQNAIVTRARARTNAATEAASNRHHTISLRCVCARAECVCKSAENRKNWYASRRRRRRRRICVYGRGNVCVCVFVCWGFGIARARVASSHSVLNHPQVRLFVFGFRIRGRLSVRPTVCVFVFCCPVSVRSGENTERVRVICGAAAIHLLWR